MKKFSKLAAQAAVAVSLFSVGAPTFTSAVQASSIENVTQDTLSLSTQTKLDPYVKVEHNQYVLSESAKNVVSAEEYRVAQQMIEQSNTVVANSGSVINRKTKVATNDFTLSDENSVVSLNKGTLATSRSRYHYGVNKVTYHWNYIRVYLNKNLTQAVASGAVGGVGTLIASYVTGGAATFAVGVISSSVDVLVTNGIKGGVWVDYNFFTGTVTGFGWQ